MDGHPLIGKKLLLTGASGFTGYHACQRLVDLGIEVAALVRKPAPGLTAVGADVFICDMQQEELVQRIVERVQPNYVLHLAGMNAVAASWQYPTHALHVNVMGTVHLLNALRQVPDARSVIVTSKLKAILDPTVPPAHPYSYSKALQESVVLAWSAMYGLDVMLAAPSNLIGPGPSTGICSLLGKYTAERERGHLDAAFSLSAKHDKRDFLDVRDAIAAYEAILCHGERGKTYRVESGQQRTLEEVATLYRRLALVDLPLHWREDGTSCSRSLAGACQTGSGDTDGSLDMTSPELKAWGWQPRRSFEHTVADILNYYRAQER
ncbi:NAD-dependent epimerase/dehydratase family protein [Paenibacillus sp. UMB4589-SE434]|uniref:NAD-dependent epimerase/dehydratase family protein n=1 Tax=Paenibacillus sp. UMB4589-SE434 TaxID=3046314 RepID=UPI00254C3BDB|nr:NAD-dependent epimerase/dehydratase family protein [Paenibacillus sp. UMB4589-SE434]MDK8183665.1 NAD-dependent epimerase/dehydratase family protein [Paenibacillus sp. UMB4589-SE434]